MRRTVRGRKGTKKSNESKEDRRKMEENGNALDMRNEGQTVWQPLNGH